MTLSHCWGELHFIQLLEDNLSEMMMEISLSDLPKTFQDAVKITRELGFRFLWIDSLCIIQDSRVDWEEESISMGNIYKNAIFNIAATSAENANAGCCFPRQHIVSRHCVISFDAPLDQDFNTNRFIIMEGYDWIDSIVFSPLNTRAWVVQEQFLSPRILHFAKDQVFWECNELVRTNILPPSPFCLGVKKLAESVVLMIRYRLLVKHSQMGSLGHPFTNHMHTFSTGLIQ